MAGVSIGVHRECHQNDSPPTARNELWSEVRRVGLELQDLAAAMLGGVPAVVKVTNVTGADGVSHASLLHVAVRAS